MNPEKGVEIYGEILGQQAGAVQGTPKRELK